MSAKHVAELNRAKKRIKSMDCVYICDALRLPITHDDYPRLIWSKESKQIKDAIDTAINGSYSVYHWLETQGIDLGHNYSPEMREYRLAWIDQMIEYWRDKK